MYLIRSDDQKWFADRVALIRLHDNGSYVLCEKSKAQGFCAKLADLVRDEETGGETVRLTDRVFAFAGKVMHGDEPMGSYEEIGGAVPLTEDELALAIITGEVTA